MDPHFFPLLLLALLALLCTTSSFNNGVLPPVLSSCHADLFLGGGVSRVGQGSCNALGTDPDVQGRSCASRANCQTQKSCLGAVGCCWLQGAS